MKQDHSLIVDLGVYSSAACEGPELLHYHLVGAFHVGRKENIPGRPAVLQGDLKKASLIFYDGELLKEANRAPGLYGITNWALETETSFEDRLPQNFLAALAPEIFPSGERVAMEGGSLHFGDRALFTQVR